MRKIFLLAAFLFGFNSVSSSAQVYPYIPHYYYYSYYTGYPVGWGYISYPYWPANYWHNVGWNGFSYYTYFPTPQYATYGVISYSAEKDVWGSSWGKATRDQAAYTANAYCSDASCQPVVWVQGGCAVLMTSASTQRVTWGTGVSRVAAQYSAKRSCGDAGDCSERAWICTY